MRYRAVATDYDGTVATDGRIDSGTLAALERCRKSGRKLILVTGRELDELIEVCPELPVFDWVVAENGALLYEPSTREEKPLADPPSAEFVAALRAAGVERVSVGRVIVATWQPHEHAVLQAIRDFGLELQVIFNKGAVMVLPTGINKATGLAAVLEVMGLSPHNVVGIGDAENDHALLASCEVGVAVSNSVPTLKERADLVTVADHGRGVAEMIDQLIANDLEQLEPRLTRHYLLLGHREDGSEVRLPPYHCNVNVVDDVCQGETSPTAVIIERLCQCKYQFVIIDPEGNFAHAAGAVSVGTKEHPPEVDEVVQLLKRPSQNVLVNLAAVSPSEQPGAFQALLAELFKLREQTGHPHWIVVNHAHRVLPSDPNWEESVLPQPWDRMLLANLNPAKTSTRVTLSADTAVATGPHAHRSLAKDFLFKPPALGSEPPALEPGEAVFYVNHKGEPPVRIKLAPTHTTHCGK